MQTKSVLAVVCLMGCSGGGAAPAPEGADAAPAPAMTVPLSSSEPPPPPTAPPPAAPPVAPHDAGAEPPADAAPDAAPDAPPPMARIPLSYSLVMAPGEETDSCVLGGTVKDETWISGWSAKLAFVHHAGVWIAKAGAPVACGGTFLFTALTADFRQVIPVEGGALRIPAGSQLILDVHRLNTTTEMQTARADLELDVAAIHSVEVFNNGIDGHTISVPPMTEKTLTYSCAAPPNIRIISMLAHTHSHTKALIVKSNGVEVYNSPNWSEPQTKYFEPFSPGTVEWSCDIANTTAATMTYGLSRDRAEMCQVYMLMLGGTWSCKQ
jgi:hypothetical protein